MQVQEEEMNKFLKGIYMGIDSFAEFYRYAKDDELKNVLKSIEDSFRKHEIAITSLILKKGISPADSKSFMGNFSEVIEKIKLNMMNDDFKLCQEAIKAINMGIISGIEFIREHRDFDDEMISAMRGVVKDYDNHILTLKEYMLNH